MSENSNNTKMIVNELRELKNSINTLNLILVSSDIGRNLKTYTNYEINKNLLQQLSIYEYQLFHLDKKLII